MKNRDSFRGTSIDNAFADSFKKSLFYNNIYVNHKNEIIIGVRDSFINLYYNCDSIAKIEVKNPNKCIIDKYYTNGEKNKLTDNEFVSLYDTIIENSNKRKKNEKQAQQRLFMDNNNNSESKWFCIDVEYTKSLQGKRKAEDWRFDIIAISKDSPFHVALIELKYGASALKEPSGIRTHVKDFYSFFKNKKFETLKPEIITIIHKLHILGVDVPESLRNVSIENFASEPEFYFITLNDNPDGNSNNTPKQTMSGYLFSDKRWKCNRLSSLIKKEGDYFDMIEHNSTFRPVFLFSKATLPDIQIKDILDRTYYDVEIVNQ
ncbi:MAG: hypothetical protein IKT00_12115 [Prevotella sp.]|nr:hypothetical protein [Prevotella sp.]